MFLIFHSDRPVVRVLGTVMTRHDTLGGWLPYLNGGQSKIGIHESMDKRRYRIYGWRISDKKVTLLKTFLHCLNFILYVFMLSESVSRRQISFSLERIEVT